MDKNVIFEKRWRPFWISQIFGPYQLKDFIRFLFVVLVHHFNEVKQEKPFEPIFSNQCRSFTGLIHSGGVVGVGPWHCGVLSCAWFGTLNFAASAYVYPLG